ncbi:MAG: TIGR02281 family clan AA aspartic protease [Bacteroidia bacterium]
MKTVVYKYLNSFFMVVLLLCSGESKAQQESTIPETINNINYMLRSNPNKTGATPSIGAKAREITSSFVYDERSRKVIINGVNNLDGKAVSKSEFYADDIGSISLSSDFDNIFIACKNGSKCIKYNSDVEINWTTTQYVYYNSIYEIETKYAIQALLIFPENREFGRSLTNKLTHLFNLIQGNYTTDNNNTSSDIIKLKKMAGGTYEIPVTLNGVLKINFIFDSGASDVSISPDVAATLIKTGTVKDSDFIGKQTYVFADGSSASSTVFIIRKIQIGNHEVTNIRASISGSIDAPMLLGQSVLERFGKITIDNVNQTLTFQR